MCKKTETDTKRSNQKAKASNRKTLHDMVMKRLSRYVGNEENEAKKPPVVELDREDDETEFEAYDMNFYKSRF